MVTFAEEHKNEKNEFEKIYAPLMFTAALSQ